MRLRSIAAAVLALPLLAACGSSPGVQQVEDCSNEGVHGTGCPRTVDYKGEDLNCLTWGNQGGGVGLDCDYEEFYMVHGEQKVDMVLKSWSDEELDALMGLYTEERSKR